MSVAEHSSYLQKFILDQKSDKATELDSNFTES